MKKSILVFLFVSSITSSFYYSLKRTDGDIIKSIMFAMYVLAIKLNLVGPAIIASFEPNPPPPAEIRVLVGYTASDDYYTRPPRVYMGENKARTITQQYPCSASAITLRAGSRYDDIKETAYFLVSVWYALKLQHSYGFQPVRNQALPAQQNQLFGGPGNKYNYFSSSQSSSFLQAEKSSSMSNQEFTSLTKEQKRNLPDIRDGYINVEGHPKLIIRYGQVYFKTPDHGGIHDLPTNENGKTPKTEQNALALRDSLVEMPNRKGSIFFDDGGYQKGTNRGYDSVNIYDKNTRVIAVYKKQENGDYLFSTTCKLTPVEEAHLYKSKGNFVTEAVLKDPNYKYNY